MLFQETNCPLCNNKAKFKSCDHNMYKDFICPRCNDFCLCCDAEDLLRSQSKEQKRQLSDKSNSNRAKGQIFVIKAKLNSDSKSHRLDTEFQNRNLSIQC